MPNNIEYLDLADYLVIAAAVLGIEPELLARYANLHLAESALAAPSASFGGTEFYPDFDMKVAILGWHLIRNHPLPDGNKRAGYMSMVEFVERNGLEWDPAAGTSFSADEETVAIIETVAAGQTTIAQLRDWLKTRMLDSGIT